ncbi:MAG: hypothetical protein ACRDHZ_07580, partial [Ktedonobacteraceae bacterium]
TPRTRATRLGRRKVRATAACNVKLCQHLLRGRFHTAWTRCCRWRPSAARKIGSPCVQVTGPVS